MKNNVPAVGPSKRPSVPRASVFQFLLLSPSQSGAVCLWPLCQGAGVCPVPRGFSLLCPLSEPFGGTYLPVVPEQGARGGSATLALAPRRWSLLFPRGPRLAPRAQHSEVTAGRPPRRLRDATREQRKLRSWSLASLPCVVSEPLNCETRIKRKSVAQSAAFHSPSVSGKPYFLELWGLCLETLAVSVMHNFVLLVCGLVFPQQHGKVSKNVGWHFLPKEPSLTKDDVKTNLHYDII